MPATFSRVRARIAIPLALVILAAVAATGLGLAWANAPYSVQSGDTLYDIAIKNGVPEGKLGVWVGEVVALNGLSSPDALTVGQQLTLPVSVSVSSSSSSGAANRASGTGAGTSYTVKDGDTLFGIAASQGVGEGSLSSWVESVLSLNNLSDADRLAVGDVLKLPARPGASASSPGSSLRSGSTATTVQYTVQQGDTLYDIALKNGIGESELASWLKSVIELNDLDSPDMLALGEALKVPSRRGSLAPASSDSSSTVTAKSTITYVVKPGDTLYDIGMKNGAADATFSSWVDSVLDLNSLDSPDFLREGQSLKLPDPAGGSSGGTNGSSQASSSGFGDSITYTVQSGDTWTGIARKLKVAEDQMAAWIDQALSLSHVSKDEKLTEGVVLLVPSPAISASSGSSGAPASSPTRPRTTDYTVQSGDTLFDIAAKFKVGAGELSGWIKQVLALNDMDSADMLTVGQKLVVPGELPSPAAQSAAATPAPSGSSAAPSASTAPNTGASMPSLASSGTASGLVRGPNSTCFYTVQGGDTWDSIAQKLGVAAEAKSAWIDGIRALNNIQGNTLPVGDALRMLC